MSSADLVCFVVVRRSRTQRARSCRCARLWVRSCFGDFFNLVPKLWAVVPLMVPVPGCARVRVRAALGARGSACARLWVRSFVGPWALAPRGWICVCCVCGGDVGRDPLRRLASVRCRVRDGSLSLSPSRHPAARASIHGFKESVVSSRVRACVAPWVGSRCLGPETGRSGKWRPNTKRMQKTASSR